MTVELSPVEPRSISGVSDALVSVYRAAFSQPPHNETATEAEAFRERLEDHSGRDGFRLCVARDGESTVGFAYGFASQLDGWTRSVVSPYLSDEEAEYWFSDCFELVELAVSSDSHGRGVGGRLHDGLLAGVGSRTSVLFVNRKAVPALGLYRKRGWRTLVKDFRRPDSDVRSGVMGLRLR